MRRLEKTGMSKKQLRRIRGAGDQRIAENLMKRTERREKEDK